METLFRSFAPCPLFHSPLPLSPCLLTITLQQTTNHLRFTTRKHHDTIPRIIRTFVISFPIPIHRRISAAHRSPYWSNSGDLLPPSRHGNERGQFVHRACIPARKQGVYCTPAKNQGGFQAFPVAASSVLCIFWGCLSF